MEPIPYFYESINRNAIIIRAKQPYYDWANSVFDDDEPLTERLENNIYLIREMDSNEDIAEWLILNYEGIFVNELNDWCTDEDSWPQERTFKQFNDWFEVEISSMVLDLEDAPVVKD